MATAGIGHLVADFLQALDLREAILVGNDSGGAIAQVVAARHPQRLGGLVLATCDAFDNHPPRLFRPLIVLALPAVALVAWARVRLGDHTPAQTAAGAALGGLVAPTVFILLC